MNTFSVRAHYDKVVLQIGRFTEIELPVEKVEMLIQSLEREKSQAEAWKSD